VQGTSTSDTAQAPTTPQIRIDCLTLLLLVMAQLPNPYDGDSFLPIIQAFRNQDHEQPAYLVHRPAQKMLRQVRQAQACIELKLRVPLKNAEKYFDSNGWRKGAEWPAPPIVEVKGLPSDRSPSGVSTYRFVWPAGSENPMSKRQMWVLREPDPKIPGKFETTYQINGIQEFFENCHEMIEAACITNDWVSSMFLPSGSIIEKRLEDGQTDIPVYEMVNGKVPSNKCVLRKLDRRIMTLLQTMMSTEDDAPSHMNDNGDVL